MDELPRYRVENGFTCVDVQLATLENMFDNRDPAPFRARDLDPDLVEYLLAAAEDVSGEKFRVVFWLGEIGRAKDIEPAFRAHMAYERERVARRIRRQRREGQLVLLLAVPLLALAIAGQHVTKDWTGGDVINELLSVLAWVIMWQPVDRLVYQWIPLHRQRSMMRKLCMAPVDVKPADTEKK